MWTTFSEQPTYFDTSDTSDTSAPLSHTSDDDDTLDIRCTSWSDWHDAAVVVGITVLIALVLILIGGR